MGYVFMPFKPELVTAWNELAKLLAT